MDVRAKDCQRRFIGTLHVVEAAHEELARKSISRPFLPIVYREANVDMTVMPQEVAMQRGGNEGKSSLYAKTQVKFSLGAGKFHKSAKCATKHTYAQRS